MSAVTSLRGRLATTMTLLLALVLALAIISATAMSNLDRAAAEAVGSLVDGGRLRAALTDAITQQIRLAEGLLRAEREGSPAQLALMTDSTHRVHRRLRLLKGQGPEDQAQLNRIAEAQARMEVASAAARAWQALGQAGAAAEAAARADAQAALVLNEVRILSGLQWSRALTRAEDLRTTAARLRTILWGLFALAMIIGVVSAWRTVRSVDGPLARLVAATQRFSTGDLRAADLAGMPTELASLGSAMNTMGGRIRHLLSAVAQEAREIGASASDFSAMSEELAATSGQVSEAMVQMTQGATSQVTALRDADMRLGALRESGATTLRAAQRVTAVAAAIATMADDHREHVLAASDTLLALRETVRSSASAVREATKLADRLGGIVDRDRQLATKVGVLAVNTSIEAARAGEHGQGIAAVAEELRLLGELCEEVANEGERAVGALQAQISATARTLEAGTRTVLGVEATAARAASALAEIAEGIAETNRVASRVVQDASAAREGVATMLEHTAAVSRSAVEHAETGDSVSAAAEEQAAATQEMAAAAARLNDAAQRLTGLLEGFRT